MSRRSERPPVVLHRGCTVAFHARKLRRDDDGEYNVLSDFCSMSAFASVVTLFVSVPAKIALYD